MEELIAKLHTYPNLIAWIAGHRHRNPVTAFKSPDASRPELGFWEIETPSLRDFPQQFRTFEIMRNGDDTVSILATDVDPAIEDGSPAAISRTYAVATQQIFKNPLGFERLSGRAVRHPVDGQLAGRPERAPRANARLPPPDTASPPPAPST